MVHKNYDELTVLKTTDCDEKISFNALAKSIITKPSNVIYCV